MPMTQEELEQKLKQLINKWKNVTKEQLIVKLKSETIDEKWTDMIREFRTNLDNTLDFCMENKIIKNINTWREWKFECALVDERFLQNVVQKELGAIARWMRECLEKLNENEVKCLNELRTEWETTKKKVDNALKQSIDLLGRQPGPKNLQNIKEIRRIKVGKIECK